MRITKYRGKRIDNREWVYGSLVEAVDGVFILETGNYSVLFEEPEYHCQAMGCGLEDMNITDRYMAMCHGWEKAMERVIESYPDFIKVHPETVGQYIGRKDDKNVGIYRGDIVRIYNYKCQLQLFEATGRVTERNSAWGVTDLKIIKFEKYYPNIKPPDVIDIMYFLNIFDCKRIEVIGNIYEI